MLLMRDMDHMETNYIDDLVQSFDLANNHSLLPFSWSLLHLSSNYPLCHELVYFILVPMPNSLPSTALRFCNFLICQLGKLSGWLSCSSDLGIDNFLSTLDASNSIDSDLAPCASPTCYFTSLSILAEVVIVTFSFVSLADRSKLLSLRLPLLTP
jgi:hypothetical protein